MLNFNEISSIPEEYLPEELVAQYNEEEDKLIDEYYDSLQAQLEEECPAEDGISAYCREFWKEEEK